MKRTYRQKERAASQDRTRQKIVDAAVALHQEKGVIATSFGDVAERAGVRAEVGNERYRQLRQRTAHLIPAAARQGEERGKGGISKGEGKGEGKGKGKGGWRLSGNPSALLSVMSVSVSGYYGAGKTLEACSSTLS